MTNKIFTIVAVLFAGLLLVSPSFAVTAPDDRSQAGQATKSASTTDEKIQGIRDEVRKAVEEKLQDVLDQDIKKGWVGTIKNKDVTSLIIEDDQGNQKEVLYDSETVIVSENRKSLTIDDLAVGKNILAMGYLQSSKIMEGKRIVFIEQQEQSLVFSAIGIISDKSIETKLVAITPPKDKDQVIELEINDYSTILSKDGQDIDYDDLEIGQKIVVVFKQSESKNSVKAMRIVF